MISFKDLIQADLHFGHIASRWNPAMEPYIWGLKNNVHLIDVSKTAFQLEKAGKFLESIAGKGRPILWVGTKKAARDIVKNKAIELNNPYVTHRWIGGTLTNYSQVKKSVTKLLHFEDVLSKSEQYPYTKKELTIFQKIAKRLENNVGGIRKLQWPIGAIVLIDIQREHAALQEAAISGLPIIALVDTNVDPSLVDYPIPGNDDSIKSIAYVVNYLVGAAARGYEQAELAEAAVEAERLENASSSDVHLSLLSEDEEGEEQGTSRSKAKKVKGEEAQGAQRKGPHIKGRPSKPPFNKNKKR